MEIRGLGLINVQDMFGVASTRSSKRVELVVQLERWEAGREYNRLGVDDSFYDLLGIQIPMVRMPVAPGRNVAILVEVAARNQLLRASGHHAARRLVERVNRQLETPTDADRHGAGGGVGMRGEAARGAPRRTDRGHVTLRGADRRVGVREVAGNPGARDLGYSASTTCRSRSCRCSPS